MVLNRTIKGKKMYFWDQHKTITSYYELLSSEVCDRHELTQMEYDILMFLYNNPQHNTAADIVRYRKSTKSHVSTSLKVLEEKGLIERRIDKDNKKRVEIYILDSADVASAYNSSLQKICLMGLQQMKLYCVGRYLKRYIITRKSA